MALLAVFAITLIPPFLSERLVDNAVETFTADPEQAYDDLALARDLNPLTRSARPARRLDRVGAGRPRAGDRGVPRSDQKAARGVRRPLLPRPPLREGRPRAGSIRTCGRRRAQPARTANRRGPRADRQGRAPERRAASPRFDQAADERQRHGLGAGARAQLCLGVPDVCLHGRRRELEDLGDLRIGRTSGKEREDLALAA